MKIVSFNKSKKIPIDIKNIKLGDERSYGVHVSSDLHKSFGKLSGDISPIHTKKNFWKRNGYKKKLGYAFLLTSVLSKIYGMYFPGGNELCLRQTCNFKRPFFIGDDLKINMKIVQKNEKGKIITIQSTITNLHNQVIFDGEAILKLSLI